MASNSDIKKTLVLINNINQTTNLELKLQSLAKIKANLTNNETNLKVFKQLCGFKNLCSLLKNNSNVKVINLVLSILANNAMKSDICKEIVTEHHVLGDISSILYNVEHPSIHCRAIRLVANVAKTSLYSKYVMRFPFLSRIVNVLTDSTSSDTIITCIRAIKHLWLWDEYRVQNELVGLSAIKHCLDELIMLNGKPSLILTHLSIIQAMLNVNSKSFINQMSYLHYEWIVNLLSKADGMYDSLIIHLLLKLSTYSKTHFELAKTCLVDQIISLMWPMNKTSTVKIQQLTRILSALCKENLFRQKIIQSQSAILALLTYLDTDVVKDLSPPMGEESVANQPMRGENEQTRNLSLNEDTMFDVDDVGSSQVSTSSSKLGDKSAYLLTNAIHYNILCCINQYQYDHEGLYRFLRCNLIGILMKRLSMQIDKYEYKHSSPVCDQSRSFSTHQSLNMSGNVSPLSPGNMSPQSSSLSPLYLSPNRSPPSWQSGAATSVEAISEMGDQEDDDKSVYSPLIEFSEEDSLSNTEDTDSNEVRQINSPSILSSEEKEERLDVHIIRIMLHISYMSFPFEQLSHKNTWNTLVNYLVKVQLDDCCRNVYKILLIICKKRQFLRALLLDNFILVVHKKLCRMQHGTHCMICSNVMIYGQGILNEISNETNSHFGFSEIMHQYYRLLELDNRLHSDPNTPPSNNIISETQSHINLLGNLSQPNTNQTDQSSSGSGNQSNCLDNLNEPNTSQNMSESANIPSGTNRTSQNISENQLEENICANRDQNNLNRTRDPNTATKDPKLGQTSSTLSKSRNSNQTFSPSSKDEKTTPTVSKNKCETSTAYKSDLDNEPPLIHFMIPYLLKDHPLFHRVLFGSDAVLSRILTGLDGRYQEEAVSCVEELLSLSLNEEVSKSVALCREKCAPPPSYEGDITFLLDDGTCHKANRNLLTTRSVYFETMLCGNFKECDQKSNIKLSNISATCLVHLLRLVAHYDTCALPRDVDIYLELVVKTDEYLLHELNYKLIQLLYAPNVIVNVANIHRVYAWSLRYNDFVQSCLCNYENFFSKNEYSPLPLSCGKRMRLNENEKNDKEKRAVIEMAQIRNEKEKQDDINMVMRVDKIDIDTERMDENNDQAGKVQKHLKEKTSNEVLCDKSKDLEVAGMEVENMEKEGDSETMIDLKENEMSKGKSIGRSRSEMIVVETSKTNDKAMNELCLIPQTDDKTISDTKNTITVDTTSNSNYSDNDKLDANSTAKNDINKNDYTLMKEPGCSYNYDEKIECTNKAFDETNRLDSSNEPRDTSEQSIGIENKTMCIINKPIHITDKSIESTKESTDSQPCLISELINEIDQNKKALFRKAPSTSTLPLTNITSGVQQEGDKIQAILLLKNEPSFKLRKLQTPVAGKRKLHIGPSLSNASSSKRREDLNIHLIKLMFNSSRHYRKSVEIVANVIAMSRDEESEASIFEQFKQDLYELIFASLK